MKIPLNLHKQQKQLTYAYTDKVADCKPQSGADYAGGYQIVSFCRVCHGSDERRSVNSRRAGYKRGVGIYFENFAQNQVEQYVDIHINTDMFTLFVDTILRIHFDYGPINNFLFVLDESFGKDWLEFIYSWIFEDYIFKYMIMTDGRRIEELGLFDYLEYNNINFLFYDGSSLDSLYEATEFWNESNMCAIGTNRLGNAYAEQWLYDMIELREMKNDNFAIYEYLYSYWRHGVLEYYDIVKMAWSVKLYSLDEFWDIFDAVGFEEDLTVFDNWYGRSEVITYKPFVGEGGWMGIAPSHYLLLDDEWEYMYF